MTATVGNMSDTGSGSPYSSRIASGAVWGIVAGVVFAMMSMVYGAVAGPGLWAPPRMIATMVGFEMGASFAAVPVMLGLGIHMMLSALYGAAFAVVAGGLERTALLVGGLAFGIVLYVVNFHVMTQLEPFAAFRMMTGNWFEIAVHGVYGLILAIGIVATRRRGAPASF